MTSSLNFGKYWKENKWWKTSSCETAQEGPSGHFLKNKPPKGKQACFSLMRSTVHPFLVYNNFWIKWNTSTFEPCIDCSDLSGALNYPKECIALTLFTKPIPIYCTGITAQSWPLWEAWRGVKVLGDTGRNQLSHCRVTHVRECCWQEHMCRKQTFVRLIQVSTSATPEGTYKLGVMHRVV